MAGADGVFLPGQTGDPRPYRRNIGIAVFNRAGLVFAGRRFDHSGPEIILPGHEWQMPQGGLDPGEDPAACAAREAFEEANMRSLALLALTDAWWPYDFPPYDGPPHKLTPFRGQIQRWAAFRFTGEDSEIDVVNPGEGTEPAEFDAWGWFPLEDMPRLVVPHRRRVYERVVEAFAPYARPL